MATFAAIASGDSNFSILVATLTYIDDNLPGSALVATLDDPGQDLTVFAPTNAAFAALAADLGYAGDPADTGAITTFLVDNVPVATLNQVILYHVSGGAQSSGDIAAAGTVATLQGGAIDATSLPTLGDAEPDLLDPSLVATDIAADNGTLHVIDRVLLPVDLPGNDAPSILDLVLSTSGASGFDTNGADFDLLREAVIAADLAGTLGDAGVDLTVFAPTDAAFVGLSQALGYEGADEGGALSYLLDSLRLLSGGEDPIPLLTEVLTYHVAGESLQSSQIIAEGSVQTLQGGTLTLDGLSLVDAEPDVADPSLIATDIQANNGIVHVLDGVLLPADLLQSDGSNDVDFVFGDDGRDRIRTGRDNDLIDAKDGNDIVSAGSGNDVVLGGGGRDYIFAGRGDDVAKGEDGNDRMFGGRGNDELYGGAGHDKIFGGSGDDTIDGGTGNDRMFGGRGNDVFVFNQEDAGHDRIYSFRDGQDKIDLSGFGFESFADIEDHISGRGRKVEIDLGDVEITVYGIRPHQIDADDFIF